VSGRVWIFQNGGRSNTFTPFALSRRTLRPEQASGDDVFGGRSQTTSRPPLLTPIRLMPSKWRPSPAVYVQPASLPQHLLNPRILVLPTANPQSARVLAQRIVITTRDLKAEVKAGLRRLSTSSIRLMTRLQHMPRSTSIRTKSY